MSIQFVNLADDVLLYVVYAIKARLFAILLSDVILKGDDFKYTFTCDVSEPGGVTGIESPSFHRDELGTTRGDGIASPNGCFSVCVPDIPELSGAPVLAFENPIFFKR